MKASIEEVNSVQKRLKIELSEESVSQAFDQMFQDLKSKATIKGFRKGRAPLSMIKRLYGDAVTGDVYQKLIRENLFGAIEDNKLRPVASPVIETGDMPEQGKGFSFSALIDVMPKLEIKGYKDLSVTTQKFAVQSEMVDEELKYIQRSKAKTKPAEADAVVGDNHLITMSHTATLDGQPVAQMDVKEASVEIGAQQFHPELENAFKGMKVGESKEVMITLPENFGDKELAGKTLNFSITVNDIKELTLPSLDDELAKDLNFESLDDLKAMIQSRMEERSEQMRRQDIEQKLMQQISDNNPFDVPPSIVDQVIDSMISEMNWPSEKEKKRALSDENMRKRYREQAKVRARNTLILLEIAENEKIKVTDEDIDQHIQKMVPNANGEGIKPEFWEQMRNSLAPQLRENLIFDKTISFIIDSAKIVEVEEK